MNSARLACNWCMGIYGKISCKGGSLYSQVLIRTDMHSFDMAVCNYIKMYPIGVGTIWMARYVFVNKISSLGRVHKVLWIWLY